MKWWLIYYKKHSLIDNKDVIYIRAYFTQDIYHEIGVLVANSGTINLLAFEEIKDVKTKLERLSEDYEYLNGLVWKMN